MVKVIILDCLRRMLIQICIRIRKIRSRKLFLDFIYLNQLCRVGLTKKWKRLTKILKTYLTIIKNTDIFIYVLTYVNLDAQLSWLEHLPYKQGVIGSSPIASTINAEIAQLVEQLTCNQQVAGSSPAFGTINWGGSEVVKRGRL